MSIFQTIVDFLINPRKCIEETSTDNIKFLPIIGLLFLSLLSNQIASLIKNSTLKPFSEILLIGVLALFFYFILTIGFLSVLSFVSSFPAKNIESKKLIFFTLISSLPGILYTPIYIIGIATNIAISETLGYILFFYQLFLFVITVRTIINTSISKLLLVLFSPILFIITLFIAIIILG
jgi:hypothetical protein